MNSRQIRKLHEKKHRKESGLFIVEGEKGVLELLVSDYIIRELYATADFSAKHKNAIAKGTFEGGKTPRVITVDARELASFGTLSTNNSALAIVRQKNDAFNPATLLDTLKDKYVLALENIQDPGNLGTIIRIADWFGIDTIITTRETTDMYNPKAIAASMGSFTRIAVYTTDLVPFFAAASKKKIPIIGATLDGKNIRTAKLPRSGIIVLGSESHGISKQTSKLLSEKITIPTHGKAESLNVAVATGIILDRLTA